MFVPWRALARAPKRIFKLGFGSCAYQTDEQPVWDAIVKAKPDVFALLGDNIYGDTEDMQVMAEKYRELAGHPQFSNFRRKIPLIATWDDHDFGVNDGGREYPKKIESKALMLKFFEEPINSPRWTRDGVYTSYLFGEVQVILLDLRWFRSPLATDEAGHYIPNPDPAAVMLGEAQWTWLERKLRKPAKFRIVASSTQFVSPVHHWEKWANFPREKARLLKLIDDLKLKNLVIISGDMHFAEISMETTAAGYDLYDLTASGLNFSEGSDGIDNPNRLALFEDCNFGLVTVDTQLMQARLELCNVAGQTVAFRDVQFTS
jgi:alkaline phosphatase D